VTMYIGNTEVYTHTTYKLRNLNGATVLLLAELVIATVTETVQPAEVTDNIDTPQENCDNENSLEKIYFSCVAIEYDDMR
jgi:hypothetical protein